MTLGQSNMKGDYTMTALDMLFSNDASLRVQQANYRKTLLSILARSTAQDLMDGKTNREVAIPVISGFLKSFIPAGRGQAEKADSAANAMVDEELQALGHVNETVEEVVSEGEKTEEGQTDEVTSEDKPSSKRKVA